MKKIILVVLLLSWCVLFAQVKSKIVRDARQVVKMALDKKDVAGIIIKDRSWSLISLDSWTCNGHTNAKVKYMLSASKGDIMYIVIVPEEINVMENLIKEKSLQVKEFIFELEVIEVCLDNNKSFNIICNLKSIK